MTDGKGFAIGTTDGRVNVEYFDSYEGSGDCKFWGHSIHHNPNSILKHAYPANDVAFLP